MECLKICASGSVSRVLSSKAIICLGAELLLHSRHLSKLWPSKPLLSVLLRIGFTGHISLLYAGELLPRLSTLTCFTAGGISLLHFPLRSPSAAVSRYPALWSPDFPHTYVRNCPTYSQEIFYNIITKMSMSPKAKTNISHIEIECDICYIILCVKNYKEPENYEQIIRDFCEIIRSFSGKGS